MGPCVILLAVDVVAYFDAVLCFLKCSVVIYFASISSGIHCNSVRLIHLRSRSCLRDAGLRNNFLVIRKIFWFVVLACSG